MNFEAYLHTIAQSNPKDWTRVDPPLYLVSLYGAGSGDDRRWIETEHPDEIYTYKQDLSISMVAGLPRKPREYVAEWTKRFPDPRAEAYWLDFLFNGTQIYRTLAVSVNGGRAGLPSPKPGTLDIPRRQYAILKLADILSGAKDFDEHFDEAGMKIVDVPWPED